MHIEIQFERNVCENIGFKAMKQHMQLIGNVVFQHTAFVIRMWELIDQEEILIPSNQEFLFHMTFNLICCFDFKKSNA